MGEKTRESLGTAAIKRGLIAGAAAWLVPGLGHLVVGARGRAAAFFFLVTLTASMGLWLDGNLAVADPRQPVLSRIEVFANLSLGPIDPLVRMRIYGMPLYTRYDLDYDARRELARQGPGARATIETRREAIDLRQQRYFATWSSYGTTFWLAACLMNMLLIVDAWDIGIGRKK